METEIGETPTGKFPEDIRIYSNVRIKGNFNAFLLKDDSTPLEFRS